MTGHVWRHFELLQNGIKYIIIIRYIVVTRVVTRPLQS